MFSWKTLFESPKSYKTKIRAILGMPNPRSLKGQPSVWRVSPRLIFFAVIYPCTSNAHESEIIPHDLALLRKSSDVITTVMFNSLYERTSVFSRPDHLTIQLPHTNQPMMLWILSSVFFKQEKLLKNGFLSNFRREAAKSLSNFLSNSSKKTRFLNIF